MITRLNPSRVTLNGEREVKRHACSQESISIAVMNVAEKIVMECVIETNTSTILQFIHGLRRDLHLTFEEGSWAAWLYDLLKRTSRRSWCVTREDCFTEGWLR